MLRLSGSKITLTLCGNCGETSASELCAICKAQKQGKQFFQVQGIRIRTEKSLQWYGSR
jgi:recombinational DNA repair protein RecR